MFPDLKDRENINRDNRNEKQKRWQRAGKPETQPRRRQFDDEATECIFLTHGCLSEPPGVELRATLLGFIQKLKLVNRGQVEVESDSHRLSTRP
jgi:hypothetical protein